MSSIDRRKIIGLIATSAATALAGCGGGGDGGSAPPPTRRLWVLNLNPLDASIDVDVDGTNTAVRAAFTGLSTPIDFEFGTYSIGVRNSAGGPRLIFDGFPVDDAAPPISVFYMKGASARLRQSPAGIVNYFDSTEALVAEVSDGAGNLQRSVLAFEDSVPQISNSVNCRLIVRRASDGVDMFDSGVRARTDAIMLFPFDAVSGLVGVVGVNGGVSTASVVEWRNLL